MKVNKYYYFNFAGSVIKGKFIKEDKLNDGTNVYLLKDNKYIYPIRKTEICGNLKQ